MSLPSVVSQPARGLIDRNLFPLIERVQSNLYEAATKNDNLVLPGKTPEGLALVRFWCAAYVTGGGSFITGILDFVMR